MLSSAVANKVARKAASDKSQSGNGVATSPPRIIKKIANRKISSLRPYPKQSDFFPDISEQDLARLADSMERNGLLEPIEILPNGLVISGHQRIKAAKRLGWERIHCWVRYDLEKAGPEAVELRFHEANDRRDLTPLEKAKSYRRQMQLSRSRPRRNGHVQGDLRDYLSKQFGLSGRTLDRWERLLDTPSEVQRAVVAKKLPLLVGGEVAGLPRAIQQQIAAEIRDGKAPKEAVAAHLRKEAAEPAPETEYRRFYRSLKHAVAVLRKELPHLNMRFRESNLPTLVNSRKLIDRIVAKIKAESKPLTAEQAELHRSLKEIVGKHKVSTQTRPV